MTEPGFTRPGLPTLLAGVRVDEPADFLSFVTDALGASIEDETVADDGKLQYALVRLPGGAALEASQARAEWPAMQAAFHLYLPDVDAAHARCLAAGGRELHPPLQQPYGERSSAVEDPAGNHWYLATYTGG